MKIIISPAKKMSINTDILDVKNKPVLVDKTRKILDYLKCLSYDQLKKLLSCNDEIAKVNFIRYQNMNLDSFGSPAILSYEGIQYKYISPNIFENSYFDYIEKKLFILSGFYGILKPFDGVLPYRLEMQSKFKTDFCNNLYDFWGDLIYNELIKDDDIILNLASSEYSKVISKYLTPNIRYINFIFGEIVDNKIVEKGVYVKMARGEMIRFMAENKIENILDIKKFNRLNFIYNEDLSDDNKFVFIK